MMMWPDRRFLDLIGIELPVVQAPMANASAVDMAVAVAKAGALGSFPCAALADDKIVSGAAEIRSRTNRPINLNFFCHKPAPPDEARDAAWLERLSPYYVELGAEMPKVPLKASIVPFTAATCAVVEELAPAVVSFHFGLPDAELVTRVKAVGCKVISSATSLREARALAERGVDAIIAQGAEAGGHRGMFIETDIATQIGTLALVHEIVDAVRLPVIAAGGIVDGRGIAAAFALGATGVQIGTAYLGCPEATISRLHRAALAERDRQTVITNVLSGRPARGILTRFVREQGPLNEAIPNYPLATPALTPLRAKAEATGSPDFSLLWAGQSRAPSRNMGAGELTKALAQESLAELRRLASSRVVAKPRREMPKARRVWPQPRA
jgi:nitronate monooxygenase